MAGLFLALIYATFISLGLPDALLGAVWPVMRTDLGAGLDAAGGVFLVIWVGTIFSGLMCERFVRWWGTGRLVAFSVLLTAGGLFAVSFADSLAVLALAMIPLGLGGGAIDTSLNSYAAAHYSSRHMNWLHGFWGVGALVGPLIMGAVIAAGIGWQGGYRIVAGIQLCVAVALFVSLVLWRRFDSSTKEENEAQKYTEKSSQSADVNKEETQSTSKQAQSPKSGIKLLRERGVIPAMLCFFFYSAVEMGVSLWGSSFLVEMHGFEQALAATLASLLFFGVAAGRFVSGFLSAALGTKRLTRIGILLVCVGVVMLILPYPFAAVGLPLIGLGCAPIYPGMVHETPRRFGRQNAKKVMGWQMVSSYAGIILVPPLMGVLAQAVGLWVLLPSIGVFVLGLFFLSERINSLKKSGDV